ncbi:tetratricopeptide repeat protein [Kribbella sp. NPDC051770]|uniref:ATP-binding protein n=1 Tax=Kribbella sp. NPDC051770 TaxID=3155413 RepID=UPI0034126849
MNELPDPDGVTDLDQLVEQLRALKVWGGNPSYDVIARRIAERSGQPARKSTVADCFRLGRRRIDTELLLEIVQALHPDSGYVARWQHALRVVAGETAASAHVSVDQVLPEDLVGFTGRAAELDRLRALLVASQADGNAVVISAIEGMAGVGKTRFVVHAGHLLAEDEPFERVLFVNLRGFFLDPQQPPADPAAVLDGFLRRLGVPAGKIPHGLAARTALYRERLTGTRTLVVLDNAATEEQVRPLLPQTPGCLTMITSRRSLSTLPGTTRFEIDVFSRDEAVGYLTRHLPAMPVGEDPTAAERIAHRCGFLPLALSLVTAHIGTTTGWTLTDHADRLDERHRSHRIDDAVEVALDLSYEHLPAEHRRMLRLLALHPGQGFDAYAAAALTDSDLLTAEQVLDDLQRDNLLIRTASDRYAFHDLVRVYGAAKAADEERRTDRQAALTRLFDLYLGTAARSMDVLHPSQAAHRPKVPTPSSPTPVLAASEQALAWLETEHSNLVATAVHAAEHDWPDYTSLLARTLSRYLVTNLGTGAGTILQHAYRAARVRNDAESEAYAALNLGTFHSQLTKSHEVLEWLELALRSFAAIDDPVGTASALNHLGNYYTQTNDWERSADHFRRGLAAFEQIGDLDGQALILSNLANVHKRTAHYPEALETLHAALALYEQLGNLDGQAAVLTNLAVVYEFVGDLERSAQYAGRAPDLFRQIGHRLGEARAELAVGVVTMRLGDHDAARAQFKAGLLLYRELGSQGGEGGALDALGELEIWAGRPERAIEYFEQSLPIFRRIGARDAEAASLSGLGEAAHEQGRYADAITLFTDALAVAGAVSSGGQQARALVGLGHAHRALGDPDGRAAKYSEQAAAIYQELAMAPIPSPAERPAR